MEIRTSWCSFVKRPDAVSSRGGQASALRLRPTRFRGGATRHCHRYSPRHNKIPLASDTRSTLGHIRTLSSAFGESPTRDPRTQILHVHSEESITAIRLTIHHSRLLHPI